MNKNQQQELITECRSSGLTARAWCEEKGISYHSYVYWATNYNRENRTKPQWAEITVHKEKIEDSGSEIKLSCGKWTICVQADFNPELLAGVLRMVDAIC